MKMIGIIILLLIGLVCILSLSVNAEWHTVSFGGTVTVEDEPTNDMYILGDESDITTYGNFNISVYLDPADYIKSWAFSIQFNQSALNVVSTNEGDFFKRHGYTTIYNSGTTNNSNGTINLIYSLILGVGNTSEAGYLYNITFEPMVAQGTSWINFNTSCSLGISNETIFLDLNYTNGTVTLDIADFPDWSNWSLYWKIGQTSLSDVTLNMVVDINDITEVTGDYGETGAPGWIIEDITEDGEIDIHDITSVTAHYGDDYT